MADQQHFEQIYFDTYQKVLKYIVTNCFNMDDVNDLIQEVYIEFYNLMCRGKVDLTGNLSSFVIGISKNKMKDFYRKKNRFKIFTKSSDDEADIIENIPDDINIENLIINLDTIESVWEFLKSKKVIIGKIFYLHYYSGMTIKDISRELDIKESAIKNHLYRTIKEMHNYFDKELINDEK